MFSTANFVKQVVRTNTSDLIIGKYIISMQHKIKVWLYLHSKYGVWNSWWRSMPLQTGFGSQEGRWAQFHELCSPETLRSHGAPQAHPATLQPQEGTRSSPCANP